jgi:iron complex transport system permease protein
VTRFFLFISLLAVPALVLSVASKIETGKAVTPLRVSRVCALLLGVFLAVAAIAAITGPHRIDLLSLIRQDPAAAASPEHTIIFSVRIPRILLAAIVGATLSTAGAVFQGLLRNPLADPYILGVSGGAAVGAVLGIIAGLDVLPFGVPVLAFLGSLLTIFLVFGVAGRRREAQSGTLLLSGVIVNSFCTAAIMFLISTVSGTRLHGIMFWLMGDLGLADTSQTLLGGVALLAGFIVIYLHARALNLLVIGEEQALQLGVDVEKTRRVLFFAASFITAAAVSLSGLIGFVGLLVPHLIRMIFGSDFRLLLPASFIFGATFLVAADTLARTALAPSELPVGVITALFGAPFFIYLLKKTESGRCRF